MTNQCDHCVFKSVEDQSTPNAAKAVEDKYQAIRAATGAPEKPRYIFVGGDDDRTETCHIDSPSWKGRKETIYCSDRVDSASGLSLEAALTLRHASVANRIALQASEIAEKANLLARDARIWAIMAAIIATAAIIIPIFR